MTILAITSEQGAWLSLLVVGLAVAFAVVALLAGLLIAARRVETSIWQTWRMGQSLEGNTVMTYLLKTVRDSGAGLVSELDQHRRSGGRS
ncbi:MAG: hypothetical protein M3M99_02195 [Actinomycetota bacterium]|nr:hypothetical protein [Actinomycetota bacterium]